jgi:hypothetical protein
MRSLASSAMGRGTKTALSALLASAALAGCGGGTPDTDGDLSAAELAAKLPQTEFARAAAVDVAAAKEAAGLEPDADPLELDFTPAESIFASSAFFGLHSVSQLVENPVREAFDHSLISAYAGQPYLTDEGVTLVSTSQPYEEIASALEDAGWQRDGDVLSSDGNPEEVTYTAIAPGDGFIVLGYDAELVEQVASGDAAPSESGELELLEGLDAPAVLATIPETEGLECVDSITYEDPIDGTVSVRVAVPSADEKKLDEFESYLQTIGFAVTSIKEEEDALEIEFQSRQFEDGVTNSPALLVFVLTDEDGKPFYDCR